MVRIKFIKLNQREAISKIKSKRFTETKRWTLPLCCQYANMLNCLGLITYYTLAYLHMVSNIYTDTFTCWWSGANMGPESCPRTVRPVDWRSQELDHWPPGECWTCSSSHRATGTVQGGTVPQALWRRTRLYSLHPSPLWTAPQLFLFVTWCRPVLYASVVTWRVCATRQIYGVWICDVLYDVDT